MRKMSITLKVRLICSFFENLIVMAFLPFIALYLTDMVNQAFSGIFLFILVLINFPISMISGHIIERYPKKRTMLIYQIIECISLLAMAFSVSNQTLLIMIFCIAYTVFSISSGMIAPLIETMIMDAITPEVEHYIYKVSYWLTNVAVACGAFLGGAMYHANKSALFLIAFVIFVLVFVALYIWIPNDNAKPLKKEGQNFDNVLSLKGFLRNYQLVLKDKLFMYLIIGSSILLMGELSTSSYVSIRLKKEFETLSMFNVSIDGVKMYSILIMTNTLVVIALTYFVSKYILKMNNQKALFVGLIMYVVGYSGITYLNDFTLLIIVMVIATLGEMIYSPITEEHRYKMIPAQKRGTYSAIRALSFNFAQLIARLGIILGVLMNALGMTIYMALILTLGSILLYRAVYQFNLKANNENH
ncbi:MDR family MFS transporter [Staphylococcus capitis]|uniref:MDR family MFS transporter n=1 Tax=Staphylococcus capitis TaxID=29388 RepID=UPI000BFCBB38|nr:MFS transporter [Staphylococcus capitis]ATN03819.1 MFS transporter [Staphylococcus capitis]GMX40906.1 MFS transporter [Streptococcus canis]